MSNPIQQEIPRELKNSEIIMKRTTYNSTILHWNNFQQNEPDKDRMFLLWCNLGKIAKNMYLTYRDASGAYDLPPSNKKYLVKAWAYVDMPHENQENLSKIKNDLRNQENETK